VTIDKIIKFFNNAPAQYVERWKEFWALQPHEQKQLYVCLGLAFVFVYGITALACAQ